MGADWQSVLTTVSDRCRSAAPAGWLRLLVNWEVEADQDGDRTQSSIKLAVVARPDGLAQEFFKVPSEVVFAVEELHRAMSDAGRPWTSLDLVVDRDAEPRVETSQGPAKRLHGVRDFESHGRFKTYLEDHRAELEELAARVG